MRPILFSLGRLNFYSYGFFTAAGIILGAWIVNLLLKRKRLVNKKEREYLLVDGLLISLVGGIIVARLAYILFYNILFRTETLAFSLELLSGGFVFTAGLLAGLGLFSWWLKRHDQALLPWLDCLMIGIISGYGLSEIGGYLNDSFIYHLAGFVACLGLAGAGYGYLVTEKKPGQTFWAGLFLFFLLQFFLGFWRPEQIIWFGLTFGQWWSLILMMTTGLINYRLFKR